MLFWSEPLPATTGEWFKAAAICARKKSSVPLKGDLLLGVVVVDVVLS